jgi:hypothetical protein
MIRLPVLECRMRRLSFTEVLRLVALELLVVTATVLRWPS